MITTVIFDYDGVIANSDHFNLNALQVAFQSVGLKFHVSIYKQYFTGRTLKGGLEYYLGSIKKMELYDVLYEAKRAYDASYKSDVEAYADALILIKALKKSYTLAIASGARKVLIDMFLERYKLHGFFSVIVSADDVIHGKPHPEVYVKAIEALGVSKSTVCAVEDSPAGIVAAHSAGIAVVGVTHTHIASALSEADFIVNALDELDFTTV